MYCILRIHKLIILLVSVLATPGHASEEAYKHYEGISARIDGSMAQIRANRLPNTTNTLLTSALDAWEWPTLRPGRFTHGKEQPVPNGQEARCA
jgi:hypothetical protein